jgi:hypothetical protein
MSGTDALCDRGLEQRTDTDCVTDAQGYFYGHARSSEPYERLTGPSETQGRTIVSQPLLMSSVPCSPHRFGPCNLFLKIGLRKDDSNIGHQIVESVH